MKQVKKILACLTAVLLLFSTLTVGMAVGEEQAVPVDFSEIPGILVGNWTDTENGTGCTVIVVDDAAGGVAGVDVRGGSPGTRETDLLNPTKEVQTANAICLSGGSAFGLDAAGVCIEDALRALTELTGEDAAEAVIDEVFSTFCVGK